MNLKKKLTALFIAALLIPSILNAEDTFSNSSIICKEKYDSAKINKIFNDFIKYCTYRYDHGDNLAGFWLGIYYMEQTDNLDKAFSYFREVIDKGHIKKLEENFYIRAKNFFSDQNYKSAFNYAYISNKLGNKPVKTLLAELYHKGRGTTKNLDKAIKLYNDILEDGSNPYKDYAKFMLTAIKQNSTEYRTNKIKKKIASSTSECGRRFFGQQLEIRDDKKIAKIIELCALEALFSNPQASYLIGSLHINGFPNILDKNIKEGMEYLQKSAEYGYSDAAFDLANLIFAYNSAKDFSAVEATRLYKIAADSGNPDAKEKYQEFKKQLIKQVNDIIKNKNNTVNEKHFLASIYKSNLFDHNRQKQSVDIYRELSENGDAEAADILSSMYYSGDIVEKDYDKFLYWKNKAANSGSESAKKHAVIMYLLGYNKNKMFYDLSPILDEIIVNDPQIGNMLAFLAYYMGKGVKKDSNKAYNYLLEASHLNAPDSKELLEAYDKNDFKQNEVGCSGFLDSLLEPISLINSCLPSAKKGNIKAQIKLAFYYNKLRNYKESFEWTQKAAKQGNLSAGFSLAIKYLSGEGVKRDNNKGLDLIRKAATDNYPPAQYMLATFYKVGFLLKENRDKAIEWYKLAAKQGNQEAIDVLANIK